MRFVSKLTMALVGALALFGVGFATVTPADAASGTIHFSIVKGGFFVGAEGGNGVLEFRGRRYPLSIGGISGGLVFGASQTNFSGRVTNIRRASDVAGTYGAAGAGAAVGAGVRVITLRNEKGAILRLQGQQVGLMANLDLSGLVISMRR
ncbi:hypothetical protein [Pseudorhodoplanes sp.]|uniref:hypothetical protein n=1 Tax=Pseudorhodoplanes sp. TaxID=1934341 RepID=UPI002B61C6FD|nr:hypothetical protein [Pseudorhodoplanes sp.]HWM83640.1 hypothetical protein [Pseudolabrys sp.]HWV55353.1 hypothetical protein [Pseudorhodoplanes sp.]